MSWKNVYKEFIEKDDLGVAEKEVEMLQRFLDGILWHSGTRGQMLVRKFEDAMERLSRDDMVEVAGMVTLAEEITGVKYEECQK